MCQICGMIFEKRLKVYGLRAIANFTRNEGVESSSLFSSLLGNRHKPLVLQGLWRFFEDKNVYECGQIHLKAGGQI